MNQLNVITSTVATASAWLQGGGSESVNRHQRPKEWRRVEPTWLPLTAKHRVYFMWCYVWRFFGSVGRTFTTTTWNCWAASRTEERSECTASEEEESQGERERTEQEQSYAVILMVCAAVCLGLVDLAPSGSVLVVLRLRVPSVEPTLEAEWVLERTSRVIPAVGTGRRQRHESGVSNRTDQHGAASCVCHSQMSQSNQLVLIWIVHTVTEQLDSNLMTVGLRLRSHWGSKHFLFSVKTQKAAEFYRTERRKRHKLRRQIWITM